MVKTITPQSESTDFYWSEAYWEDIIYPKYIRYRARFPRSFSRTEEGNIDWYSDQYKRSFRGYLPGETIDYANLSIRPPQSTMSSKYRYVNNAPNTIPVPKGYMGTSSGIFPFPSGFIPFTEGTTTDSPRVISTTGTVASGINGQFIIADSVEIAEMVPQNIYYFSYSPEVGRFEWEISPEFQMPTEPEVRYPSGARRKRTFRY